jgi:hypothetical protein
MTYETDTKGIGVTFEPFGRPGTKQLKLSSPFPPELQSIEVPQGQLRWYMLLEL